MLKKSLPHGGELVILDAVGVPFGVVYMDENNCKEDLALKVKQALASMKSQLKFRGFSEEYHYHDCNSNNENNLSH